LQLKAEAAIQILQPLMEKFFLQRLSIIMQRAVLAMIDSVRLTVRPSVTVRHHVKMTHAIFFRFQARPHRVFLQSEWLECLTMRPNQSKLEKLLS